MKQHAGFASVKSDFPSISSDLVQSLYEVMLANRLEFFMFFSAMVGYLVLCCVRAPKPCAPQKKDSGQQDEADDDKALSSHPLSETVNAKCLNKKDTDALSNQFQKIIQQDPDRYQISDVNTFLEDSEDH